MMILYHMYCLMMAQANMYAPFCSETKSSNSSNDSSSTSSSDSQNANDSKMQTVVNIYNPVSASSNAENVQQLAPGRRVEGVQNSTTSPTAAASPTASTPNVNSTGILGLSTLPTSTSSPLDNLPTSTFPSIAPFGKHPMFTQQGVESLGHPPPSSPPPSPPPPRRANSRMSYDIFTPLLALSFRKSSNLTEDNELKLKGFFELARKYIERSLMNATYYFNHAASPVSLITLSTLLQYIESDCKDIGSDILLSLSPMNGSINGDLPYTELIEINLINNTYEKCDLQSFATTLGVTVTHDNAIRHLEMKYIFKLTMAWSSFSSTYHCSFSQDTFLLDDLTRITTNYLTLFGIFETGWIESITAKYISIPFPGYNTDELKLVIILPTSPPKNIIMFTEYFYAHLEYGDFSDGIKRVARIMLPHILIHHVFTERNRRTLAESPLTVETLIDITASVESNQLCKSEPDDNQSEVFKVNRSFVFLIMWKTALISSGIVNEMVD